MLIMNTIVLIFILGFFFKSITFSKHYHLSHTKYNKSMLLMFFVKFLIFLLEIVFDKKTINIKNSYG